MPFNYSKYQEIASYIDKKSTISTKIVAVSKNHEVFAIQEAIGNGVRMFGENRVQEAILKFKPLKKTFLDLELHLTGPLQTNKVKLALSIFDIFQTLDREKLAREFIKYPLEIKNKKFFIQVNIGKEENKSGIDPKQTKDFVNYCKNELSLNIIGLMCIPPINEDAQDYFIMLKKIAQENNLKNLSMGMTSDYKKAIINGATHIRVGTALFGKRSQ